MCGICGIFQTNNQPVSLDILNKMNDSLIHRGPDSGGHYVSASSYAAIAMRRLSIIDINTGDQPIHNENKTIWIVFNGEIYNYKELRKELEQKGHVFYTQTDTEVIVHLYEEEGVKCAEKLRGMFAFAIWNNNNEQIFIARDRIGKKPLFYSINEKGFIFASEIKALLKYPGVSKQINPDAVHAFLTFQYVPHPISIFTGINKLPPASYLTFDKKNGIRIETYWKLSFADKVNISENECMEKIREIMLESVSIRLRSDVPLGAFLSGGVDSSVIVALMSTLCTNKVKTFSIGFDDDKYSEVAYAKKIAELYNTDHTEFIVTPDLIKNLPEIMHYIDEPFADNSVLPTFILSKLTRKHVKVALNGDGGDENFAGYTRYSYQSSPYYRSYMSLPQSLRNKLFKIASQFYPDQPDTYLTLRQRIFGFLKRNSGTYFETNHHIISKFDDDDKSKIYTAEFADSIKTRHSFDFHKKYYNESGSKDIIDKLLYAEMMTYLNGDLLFKMDMASMANSLEVRSPMLDHKLIEFCASLPSGMKIKNNVSKYILKKTYSKMIPDKIMKRNKQGFNIPIDKWFRKDLKDYIKGILLDNNCVSRGYFKKSAISNILNGHFEGIRNSGDKLWTLLIFELWHREYIDKK